MSLANLAKINMKEVDLKRNNIEQGKDFLNYEEKCINKMLPDVLNVQKTTSPKLGSIIENMQNLEQSIKAYQPNIVNNMSNDELEFNKTLAKYSSLHNSFFEDQLKPIDSVSTNKNNTYMSNLGETFKYNNDSSKNTNINSLTYSGKNIKNAQTGEIAWVDIKGYKHVYSAGLWMDKSSSCPGDFVLLNSEQYDKVPMGSPMVKDGKCNLLDVNPTLWNNLNNLSNKLVSLASNINKQFSENKNKSSNVMEQQTSEYQSNLTNKINELSKHNNLINKIDLTTIDGMYETSNNLVVASYYQYLVWFLLTITVLFLLVKFFTLSDNIQSFNVILLIIVLFIIYFVSKRS
jgi:hypothetical protein